jgi:nucleoside-diphosphate-sugar epimerase
MKRVLVTGGPGFIGRRVVQRFLSAGWEVTSFSLPGEAPIADWSGAVRMVYGDLADGDTTTAAAADADLVIHLAAVVGMAGGYQHQWNVIAEGTRNVCAAMAGRGARAVVVSSIAVYGEKIQHQICREDDGHGPWTGAYGRAKQGQEDIALENARASDLKLTIVRPANVYGLGGSSAWGDRLLAAIRATGGAIIGDGEHNNAGLVYVENLADALFLAGTSDAAVGRTYNVCDEEQVTWRMFMDDMARIVGMPPPPLFALADVLGIVRANENPAGLVEPADPRLPSMEGVNLVGFDNRIDASRIRTELAWTPRFSYAEAMQEISQACNTR